MIQPHSQTTYHAQSISFHTSDSVLILVRYTRNFLVNLSPLYYCTNKVRYHCNSYSQCYVYTSTLICVLNTARSTRGTVFLWSTSNQCGLHILNDCHSFTNIMKWSRIILEQQGICWNNAAMSYGVETCSLRHIPCNSCLCLW